MPERQIFKSATTAPNAVRDALGMCFAQELLLPSPRLILVAPWISNIVIFDNRMGQYDGLNPAWDRREIRLVDVLVAIACNNTVVDLRVRTDAHNQIFKPKLFGALGDAGVKDRCLWSESSTLHTKSLLTDRIVVGGSMNFTENGIALNDETVWFSFDARKVALAHTELDSHGQH
jgi:phosphatidylserine/phosphatidylglycerophosphate/cardiolipin synthase-like enzyme